MASVPQKSLLSGTDTMDIVSKLSRIEMSDIQEKSSRCVPILRRCLKFLQATAANRNYIHIPPILKFVRMANSLDDWLISSSSIILPRLNNLYCTILAEADPDTQQSPGKVNVAISSRVKRDKDAMLALCSVFEVCVGFCDLVDDDNQHHLGIFLRSSAAVLFGSDFQKERDTLNETEYAMDELARYSSYALSNIMLTYPAVVPMAEGILGKRLRGLFKFLHSSPELSINRSLILILRSLYQRCEVDKGNSNKCRSLIDEEFSRSVSGRQSVLNLFQEIDMASENAATQAENISLTMYSRENDEVCFKSVNCGVQVKERRSCRSRRRVPFRCASIDWNRNSFAIHREGELPEYWPLFLVSNLDWKKGRQELHLQLEEGSGKEPVGIVIRFRSDSLSESKKDSIEDRLDRTMGQVRIETERKIIDQASKARKVSQAMMRGVDRWGASNGSTEARTGEGSSSKKESTKEGPEPSVRATERHIFSENPPHKVYAYDSHAEGESETFSQSSYAGSEKEGKPRFKPGSYQAERNDNGSPHASSIHETGESEQTGDAGDAGDKEGSKRSLPVQQSVEEISSSEGSDNTRPSKCANRMSSPEDESEGTGRENRKEQHTELSRVAGPSWCENEVLETSHKGRALARRNAQRHLRLANGSEEKLCHERLREVCFENEEKHTRLVEEDENLRRKLQSVAKNMLQWKQQQSSQFLHDTKVNITSLREQRVRQDHELVSKFMDGLRKRSSLHVGKLTNMASHTKGVLLKTRKRLNSLRDKLMEGRQQLKVLKTQTSTDIARARDLMRKEREGLSVNLDQCIANTRRRSESRAQKNSVLQSLARLLKEG